MLHSTTRLIPRSSTNSTSCRNCLPIISIQFNGFMALHRRNHHLVCHYCGRRSDVHQDGTVRQWECRNCDAMNYIDEVSKQSTPLFTRHALTVGNRMAKSQILLPPTPRPTIDNPRIKSNMPMLRLDRVLPYHTLHQKKRSSVRPVWETSSSLLLASRSTFQMTPIPTTRSFTRTTISSGATSRSDILKYAPTVNLELLLECNKLGIQLRRIVSRECWINQRSAASLDHLTNSAGLHYSTFVD